MHQKLPELWSPQFFDKIKTPCAPPKTLTRCTKPFELCDKELLLTLVVKTPVCLHPRRPPRLDGHDVGTLEQLGNTKLSRHVQTCMCFRESQHANNAHLSHFDICFLQTHPKSTAWKDCASMSKPGHAGKKPRSKRPQPSDCELPLSWLFLIPDPSIFILIKAPLMTPTSHPKLATIARRIKACPDPCLSLKPVRNTTECQSAKGQPQAILARNGHLFLCGGSPA